jgi:hypothetical protein
MAQTDFDSENSSGLTVAAAAKSVGRNRFSEASASSPLSGREISTSAVTHWDGLCPINPRICAGGAKTPDIIANSLFLHGGESQFGGSPPTRPVSMGRAPRCGGAESGRLLPA